MALLWVLSLSDGTNSLLDIADRSGLGFAEIRTAAEQSGGSRPARSRPMSARCVAWRRPVARGRTGHRRDGFPRLAPRPRLVSRGVTVTCTTRTADPRRSMASSGAGAISPRPCRSRRSSMRYGRTWSFTWRAMSAALRDPRSSAHVRRQPDGRRERAPGCASRPVSASRAGRLVRGTGAPGSAPRSPYAAAKAAATAYARMFWSLYGLSTVVLRPAMIYGPGQTDTSKLIPYVARCFLAGEAPDARQRTPANRLGRTSMTSSRRSRWQRRRRERTAR